MKKFLTALAAALIIAILAVTAAGCSQSSNVKTAFKEAGYEITAVEAKDCEDLLKILNDEQEKDIDKYEVFECTFYARKATVVVFPSEEAMEEILGESTYASKLEGGYINGDCYLISNTGSDVLKVFKNA